MTGGAAAQPVKPVAPGTVVVHLNGYLQFDITGFGSTFNKVTSPGTTGVTITGVNAAGGVTGTKATIGAGTYKLNDVTTNGDARIYPGFDAETTNGIAYGAQIELRTTTSDANNGSGRVTGTGGAAGTTGNPGPPRPMATSAPSPAASSASARATALSPCCRAA